LPTMMCNRRGQSVSRDARGGLILTGFAIMARFA
jgi:hypothetical protein